MTAARAGRFAAPSRARPPEATGTETLVQETLVPAAAASESREGGWPFPIDFPRLDRDIARTEPMLSRSRRGTGAENRPGRKFFSLRSLADWSGPERSGRDWSILKALFSLIYPH